MTTCFFFTCKVAPKFVVSIDESVQEKTYLVESSVPTDGLYSFADGAESDLTDSDLALRSALRSDDAEALLATSMIEYNPSVETPVGLPPTPMPPSRTAEIEVTTAAAMILEEEEVTLTTVAAYEADSETMNAAKAVEAHVESDFMTKQLAEQRKLADLQFNPFNQLTRMLGAVATLGSGCSLGPEGPAVEVGAGWSRLISGTSSTQKERHHLFLAGTAAGVAAGFNAPISGVFFAIECGNRYLSKNTVKMDEDAPGKSDSVLQRKSTLINALFFYNLRRTESRYCSYCHRRCSIEHCFVNWCA